MLNFFVVEPSPHLAPVLKTHKDFCIVGCENVPALVLERTITCDLMLVSASFAFEDICALVVANQSTGTTTVISDVWEQDPELVAFLEAGAMGYIRHDASKAEVIDTLYAIYEGKPPISLIIGTALMERMHELLALQKQHSGDPLGRLEAEMPALTAREREILELIRNGASNQDIARELTIELGTVKNHVHNILKKLNVSRRDQAVLYLEREQAIK